MYCGDPADSDEHIIAVWIVELLNKDPRGLPTPTTLHVPLDDGSTHDVPGKWRRGRPTIEYTTRVCQDCNNGWMNVIDEKARPYLTAMIKGESVALDRDAQQAIATWITKVAVTARSAPPHILPIDPTWTKWLYKQRVAPPHWNVSVGHYIGVEPFWYRPEDVSVTGYAKHGVNAFLVLGYLAIQIFGISHGQLHRSGPPETGMVDIWPTAGSTTWPPSAHIDDAGLLLWAKRFLSHGS